MSRRNAAGHTPSDAPPPSLRLVVPGAPALPADWANQRTHVRAELSFAVTLMGDNNFYVGLSQNISEGGIFIATYRTLPLGTHVTMTFTLPGSTELLSVDGVVSWHRPPEAVETGRRSIPPVKTGMGVRFEDPDMDVQEAIRNFTALRTPDFWD